MSLEGEGGEGGKKKSSTMEKEQVGTVVKNSLGMCGQVSAC